MAEFVISIPIILEHEGGDTITEDPDDPGGLTKYGISQRQFPDLDIRNLTEDQAKRIYHEKYWGKFGYGGFEYQELATKIFSLAVTMGGQQAHKLLQRASRACGRPLIEDGQIGPKTLLAVNSADNLAILAALRSEAAGYYRSVGVSREMRAYKKKARATMETEAECEGENFEERWSAFVDEAKRYGYKYENGWLNRAYS